MQAGETESPKAHSVMMVVKGDGRYRGGVVEWIVEL